MTFYSIAPIFRDVPYFRVCVPRLGLYFPGTQNVPCFQVLWRMLGFLFNTKHQGTEIS